MENIVRELNLTIIKLDPRYIRLIIVLVTLILFVLGAGAPGTGGGIGINNSGV